MEKRLYIIYGVIFQWFVMSIEIPYEGNETGKYTYYDENQNDFFLCYYCPKNAFRSDEDAKVQDTKCIQKNFNSLDSEENEKGWYPYCKDGLVPSCREPPSIANGNLTKRVGGFPGYSVYSRWQVKCNYGYRITNEAVDEEFRCSEKRKWSKNISILSTVCIPEVCSPLPLIRNGTWQCDQNQRPVSVGGTCNLLCGRGFRLNIGNISFVCGDDLEWDSPNNTLQFTCDKILESGVLKRPSDNPNVNYILIGIGLFILIGSIIVVVLLLRRKNLAQDGNTFKNSTEFDSECIPMQDCSGICNEASNEIRNHSHYQAGVKQKNPETDANVDIRNVNTTSEAKDMETTFYEFSELGKTNKTTSFFPIAKRNATIETTAQKEKEQNPRSTKENTNPVTYIYSIHNAFEDKQENNSCSAKENTDPDSCILSIPDALENSNFTDFFKKLCRMLDGIREWQGLVEAVVGADEYLVKSVLVHRKGDPDNGFMKYFLTGELKNQNMKLGHILNYINKNDIRKEDKKYALELFEESHKGCEFCSEIYSRNS